MAELADAADSNLPVVRIVGVRVPSSAPDNMDPNPFHKDWIRFLVYSYLKKALHYKQIREELCIPKQSLQSLNNYNKIPECFCEGIQERAKLRY